MSVCVNVHVLCISVKMASETWYSLCKSDKGMVGQGTQGKGTDDGSEMASFVR